MPSWRPAAHGRRIAVIVCIHDINVLNGRVAALDCEQQQSEDARALGPVRLHGEHPHIEAAIDNPCTKCAGHLPLGHVAHPELGLVHGLRSDAALLPIPEVDLGDRLHSLFYGHFTMRLVYQRATQYAP